MAAPRLESSRPDAHDRAMIVLAAAAAAVLAFAAVGMWVTDMSVDAASAGPLGTMVAVLAALAAYCRWRRLRRLQPVIEIFLIFLVANLGLLPITYLVMRFDLPLADAWLMRMDAAVGFDWRSFLYWIDSMPRVAALFQAAYGSFGPQLMVLPVYLAIVGASGRAAAMVLAYMIVVVVSSTVSIWFPAEGAFIGYAVDESTLTNINAHFGYAFLSEFEAIRSAPYFVMSLDRVEGLLTFPSVHVAVAVICLWAAWGSRLLLLPFLVLNVSMALSAISHGGHYLVDVPAGAAVAVMSLALARRCSANTSVVEARSAEAGTARELLRLRFMLKPARESVPRVM